jgi:protocatechuate 3,4-dioxygenase, alpha subunit
MSQITTTQTVGPFPHEAWAWASELPAITGGTTIHGSLLDGADAPVSDGWIEAWCPVTKNWQRHASGEQGEFTLHMPKGQTQLMITIFARGLTRHLFTVVCLTADSSWLTQVPAALRGSLLAAVEGSSYRWDIHLQGANETVFFDYA